MDALLILHQLLHWYGGVQVKTTQGHDQLVFSGRFMDSASSPTASANLAELPPAGPGAQALPPAPPPRLHRCPVTACRCCVRVSSAGAVWSECVVSSSAERLLTGWMRESNAVYFNLFRMPELCPEFLLSLIPLAPASIPRSCSPLLGGALQGCCLWSPSRSELLMALLSTVLILLSLCQDIWP